MEDGCMMTSWFVSEGADAVLTRDRAEAEPADQTRRNPRRLAIFPLPLPLPFPLAANGKVVDRGFVRRQANKGNWVTECGPR